MSTEELLRRAALEPLSSQLQLFRDLALAVLGGGSAEGVCSVDKAPSTAEELAALAAQPSLSKPLRSLLTSAAGLVARSGKMSLAVEGELVAIGSTCLARLQLPDPSATADSLTPWAILIELVSDAFPKALLPHMEAMVQLFLALAPASQDAASHICISLRSVLLAQTQPLPEVCVAELSAGLQQLLLTAPNFGVLLEPKRLWLPRHAALCLAALQICQRCGDNEEDESIGPIALRARLRALEQRTQTLEALDLAQQAALCQDFWALSGFIEAAAVDAVKPDARRVGLQGACPLLARCYSAGPAMLRPALLPCIGFLLRSCLQLRPEAQQPELWMPLVAALRAGLVGDSRALRSRASGALAWLLQDISISHCSGTAILIQALAAMQPEVLRVLRQAETPALAQQALIGLRALGRLGCLHGATALPGLAAAAMACEAASGLAGQTLLEMVAQRPVLMQRLALGLEEAVGRLEKRQDWSAALWGEAAAWRFAAIDAAFKVLEDQEDEELPMAVLDEVLIQLSGTRQAAGSHPARKGLMVGLCYGLLAQLPLRPYAAAILKRLESFEKNARASKGLASALCAIEALRRRLSGGTAATEERHLRLLLDEVLYESVCPPIRQRGGRAHEGRVDSEEVAQQGPTAFATEMDEDFVDVVSGMEQQEAEQEAEQEDKYEIPVLSEDDELMRACFPHDESPAACEALERIAQPTTASFQGAAAGTCGAAARVDYLLPVPDQVADLSIICPEAGAADLSAEQQFAAIPCTETQRSAPSRPPEGPATSMFSAAGPSAATALSQTSTTALVARRRRMQRIQGAGSRCPGCAMRGAPWCLRRPGRWACDGSAPAQAPTSVRKPRLGIDALLPQFQALSDSVRTSVELMRLQMNLALEEALKRKRGDSIDAAAAEKIEPCPRQPSRRARLGGC